MQKLANKQHKACECDACVNTLSSTCVDAHLGELSTAAVRGQRTWSSNDNLGMATARVAVLPTIGCRLSHRCSCRLPDDATALTFLKKRATRVVALGPCHTAGRMVLVPAAQQWQEQGQQSDPCGVPHISARQLRSQGKPQRQRELEMPLREHFGQVHA